MIQDPVKTKKILFKYLLIKNIKMKKSFFKSALRISLLLTVLVFTAISVLKAQTKEQIEKALNDAYEKFSTAIGYSSIDIDNSDGQNNDAFKKGQYIVGNLLYYPVKNAMMGIEFQYGDRENFNATANTFSASITKVQFSFKYNFSEAFFKK